MYFTYLFRKNLLLIAVLLALFSWGIITSVMLLKKTDKLILVGIDQNGTRIISNLDDPLYKVEVVNFVKTFFSNLYSFDADSFDQNLGAASDLMSIELWKSQEALILKLGQDVKKEKITHSNKLQSISKNDDGSYQVVMHTAETYRAKTVNNDLQVRLKIKKIERTEKNPWGMEVTSLEESKI